MYYNSFSNFFSFFVSNRLPIRRQKRSLPLTTLQNLRTPSLVQTSWRKISLVQTSWRKISLVQTSWHKMAQFLIYWMEYMQNLRITV